MSAREKIMSVLGHMLVLWGALIVAYNGFKKITRVYWGPLAQSLKSDIKLCFIWVIISFGVLLLVYLLKKKQDDLPSVSHYSYLFILHILVINLIAYQKDWALITIINSAELIFIIILAVLHKYRLYLISAWREKFGALVVKQVDSKVFLALTNSRNYILAFVIILVTCAFLLMFKAEKVAEELANAAYFAILIGVGIEFYKGRRGEKGGGGEGKN